MPATFTDQVTIESPDPNTPCACSECEWQGTFKQLDAIGEAWLILGDPVPAGRCPRCCDFAYVASVYQPLTGKESAEYMRGYHEGQADMAKSFNEIKARSN